MSPRSNRRRTDEVPELSAGLSAELPEEGPDGTWMVRRVTGSASTKVYRCPGCDQEIRPATPHVVAWPADGLGDLGDRRHWHTTCWSARGRRRPTQQRGRGRPRY